MKKMVAIWLAALMLISCAAVHAEGTPPEPPEGMEAGAVPPEPPEGMEAGAVPPELPEGMEMEAGAAPPEPPEGGNPPAMPGGAPGAQSAPETYDAVNAMEADATLAGEILSTNADENAVLVTAGTTVVEQANIVRQSADSAGGDAASFYGVGAAVLTTGGTVVVRDSAIETDAVGGAGVFAYGDGVAYVSDTTIATRQDASGGIHVAGGGTLYAQNLSVTTEGESAAAIRSDRGGGTMVVEGGAYATSGVGSPAVYVTADISISDAQLSASGSEALCLEGLNAVRLYDCDLSGAMADLPQNDNTWTVIVYQSMSGDAQIGKGRFEMVGGTLTSANGGVFYTTNTESEFVLSGVDISAAQDSEYFLRATGNANQRGWGQSGQNGARCTFTGVDQRMDGDVQWDSISTLDLYLTQGSRLTGAVVQDESCAGEGGDGRCDLYIDADSTWTVTGDSVLTNLHCAGSIVGEDGRGVVIRSADGTVLVEGDGAYTVTVMSYDDTCDLTHAGALSGAAVES